MQVTRAGEYGVLGLLALADRKVGQVVMLEELSRTESISKSFLAKIFQSLVRAGLVRSVRGLGGGFVLARPPAEISVLQIIEAVEGPISFRRCQEDGTGCVRSNGCPLCGVFDEAQYRVRELFSHTTLVDLMKHSARPAPAAGESLPIAFKPPGRQHELMLTQPSAGQGRATVYE